MGWRMMRASKAGTSKTSFPVFCALAVVMAPERSDAIPLYRASSIPVSFHSTDVLQSRLALSQTQFLL